MDATAFPLEDGPLPAGIGVLRGWRISSYFGGRLDPLTGQPGHHGGMDLSHPTCYGAPILAPCAGRVSQGWDPSGGGNWTSVFGDDGCYWGLGHASRYAAGVNGQRVEAGTVIAYVGSSGHSSGAHLHVGYRPAGAYAYADPFEELVHAAHLLNGADPPPPEETDVITDDDVKRIAAAAADLVHQQLEQEQTTLGNWEWDTRGRMGLRAIAVKDRPEVWVVTTDAAGRPVRWHIPDPDTFNALRLAGVIAFYPSETFPLVDPAHIDAFLRLPEVTAPA